jgi:hypothetical protein
MSVDRTCDTSECAARSRWLRRTLLLGAATAGLWLAGSLGHAGSAEAVAPAPAPPIVVGQSIAQSPSVAPSPVIALGQSIAGPRPVALSRAVGLPTALASRLPRQVGAVLARPAAIAAASSGATGRFANALELPAHSAFSAVDRLAAAIDVERPLSGAIDLGLRTAPLPAPVTLPALPIPSVSPVASMLGLLAGALTATVPCAPQVRRPGVPVGSPLRRQGQGLTVPAGRASHRAGSSPRLGLPSAPARGPGAPTGLPPAGGCTHAAGSTTLTLLAPGSCPACSPAGRLVRVQRHSPSPRERATAPAVSPD